MSTLSKIVLATDFGPASDAALRHAVVLASAFRAEITVVHVYEIPVPLYGGRPYVGVPDLVNVIDKRARTAVDAVVHEIRERGVKAVGLVRPGSAWREINDVSREIGADLVVLGTHGRRGVPRALIGSVAEKVVRTSPVPVLTVHAEDVDAHGLRVPAETAGSAEAACAEANGDPGGT